jgi:hypothetical protein
VLRQRLPVSEIPKNRNDEEISRLKEQLALIQERRTIILQLQRLEEKDDRVRMRWEELQPSG